MRTFNRSHMENQTGFFGSERNFPAKNGPTLLSFPLDYRIVASVLQAVIFIFGFFGNILLIHVVRRTPSLQTPTYCYLVSLACADLIVLVSAIPEAVVSNHLFIRQWVLGQAGCSILIFGSMSIVAFSIERYIAVCHTMLAQKICTIRRAKRITVAVWIFCFLYCCPWLGLTESKPFAGFPDLESCNFRLSREQYVYYFIVDITLFYFLPLIMAVYVYVKIAQVLRSNNRLNLTEEGKSSRCQTDCASVVRLSFLKNSASPVDGSTGTEETCGLRSVRRMRLDNANNTQAIQILVTVVILFAISWLPFRGVLIYNTFSKKEWLNNWYQLFAKCTIYVNCSINPLLYNAMSRRIRTALLKVPCCPSKRPEEKFGRSQSCRNSHYAHQTQSITEEE